MADLLFPELKGLSGGKKCHWINAHLDMIADIHEEVGFQKTRELLYMKAETLESALSRSEKHHRPAVRQADKALLLAQRADIKADEALGQLDSLTDSVSEIDELKDNLAQYFGLMARASSMMEQIMSSRNTKGFERKSTRNFTYGVPSASKRKVGPSLSKGRGRLLISRHPGQRSKSPGRPTPSTYHLRRKRGYRAY